MEPSNQERAATARFAVAARNDSDRQILEQNIIDLLADLHYLVTSEWIGFSRCLTLAGLHHEAESPETYNGWTNYETWAVHLRLTNEQGSYFYWQEQARSHIEDAPNSRHVRDGIWIADRASLFGLADQLREVIDVVAPTDDASAYSDLLNSALSEVNWSETGQAFTSLIKPQTRRPTTMTLICAYTRKQAIEDGVLIDVTETAKEAGLRFPTAITAAAWLEYVAVPDGVTGQDERGRLWDIVWMLHWAIARQRVAGPMLHFQLYVKNDEDQPARLVTLKAIRHAGDDPSPVLTIMLPHED